MNGNTREPFRGRRATLRSRMRLDASPERIFPLLCPVREYDWIPTWSCDMIYSESGVAENDCVFATRLPGRGPRESWVVVRYEPPLAIEFVRSSAGPGHPVRHTPPGGRRRDRPRLVADHDGAERNGKRPRRRPRIRQRVRSVRAAPRRAARGISRTRPRRDNGEGDSPIPGERGKTAANVPDFLLPEPEHLEKRLVPLRILEVRRAHATATARLRPPRCGEAENHVFRSGETRLRRDAALRRRRAISRRCRFSSPISRPIASDRS